MDSGDAVLRIYAGGLVRVSKCCLAIRWDGGQGRFPTAFDTCFDSFGDLPGPQSRYSPLISKNQSVGHILADREGGTFRRNYQPFILSGHRGDRRPAGPASHASWSTSACRPHTQLQTATESTVHLLVRRRWPSVPRRNGNRRTRPSRPLTPDHRWPISRSGQF